MLAVLHLLTRRLFAVPFETGRLARLVARAGGLAVAGELLLPTSGAAGFLARARGVAAIPPALVLTGVVRRGELRALAAAGRDLRASRQSRRPPRL